MTLSTCPLCGAPNPQPCDDEQYASDEQFRATHRCEVCHRAFRFTPPDRPFNPPRLSKKEIA